jgi:hypothetical protein
VSGTGIALRAASTLEHNRRVIADSGFGQPLDTPDAISEAQAARWRGMSDAEKAALVSAMYQTTIRLAEEGIAARYPQASPRERFLRRAVLLLGADLARRVYPDVAQLDLSS